MDRTLINETPNKVGEKVKIQGFVHVVRAHGKIAFADIADRSGILQVVGREDLAALKSQYAVEIEGTVNARPESMVNDKIATGKVEVFADKVTVLAKSEEMPFDMGGEDLNLELPTLLDYRSLTLRHPKQRAIFKVQSVVIDAFRKALIERDFLEFQAPSLISAVPEGGAEVFKVDYFNRQVYLSQSPQLYKSLLVGAFERVFSVNQIFRAEPSVTTRHLTEATSLDAEFGFIESWKDVLEMQEYVIRYIFSEIEKRCKQELAMFGATLPKLTDKIPVIKLREAQEIIFKRTGRDCRVEKDLAPEDEREICKWSLEEKGSDLVFVSHFLTKKKPFYVYPDPEDPTYAFSVDLLGRGVEWSSGGQRLNDYETIIKNVHEWGLKEEDIELYLQSFRYGVPPLGGFALGAERITMHVLGLKNVREASLFPRDLERVDTRFSVNKIKESENELPVYDQIIELLDSNKIDYKHYEHEAVFTSEDSARVRGTTVHQGAKALVLDSDKGLLLFVLPSDLMADLEAIKTKCEFTKLKMASKETVKAKTGLEVGSIPPFGSLIGLKTYIDSRLSDNDEIAFNAGRHDRSVKMKYLDFLELEHPEIIKF